MNTMSHKKDSKMIKGMNEKSYNVKLLHTIDTNTTSLIKESDEYSNDISEITKVDKGDNTEKKIYIGNRL